MAGFSISFFRLAGSDDALVATAMESDEAKECLDAQLAAYETDLGKTSIFLSGLCSNVRALIEKLTPLVGKI